MNIITYTNPLFPELYEVAGLLEGLNYQVFLEVYGPLDIDVPLEDELKRLIGSLIEISRIEKVSMPDFEITMEECLFHTGDYAYGPINLEEKRPKIETLIKPVYERLGIGEPCGINSFSFGRGHPGYPVFWDFAFEIEGKNGRWAFVGCSSD